MKDNHKFKDYFETKRGYSRIPMTAFRAGIAGVCNSSEEVGALLEQLEEGGVIDEDTLTDDLIGWW